MLTPRELDVTKFLVGAAERAPSIHITQPWLFTGRCQHRC